MNANLRNFGLWVLIVLLLLAIFTFFQGPVSRPVAPVVVSTPQDGAQWFVALLISWMPFFFLVGAWMLLTWWSRRRRSGGFGTGLSLPAKQLDDPAHWRACAGEARATAERFADAQSQRRMLEIAERYEYLAQRAEEQRRASGSLS
jgi:hypothetical protein